MKIKTALAALVLALAPAIATAACFDDHSQQAMSCAEGTIWDEKTSACVDAAV